MGGYRLAGAQEVDSVPIAGIEYDRFNGGAFARLAWCPWLKALNPVPNCEVRQGQQKEDGRDD